MKLKLYYTNIVFGHKTKQVFNENNIIYDWILKQHIVQLINDNEYDLWFWK
jgi:hypothetical protein